MDNHSYMETTNNKPSKEQVWHSTLRHTPDITVSTVMGHGILQNLKGEMTTNNTKISETH